MLGEKQDNVMERVWGQSWLSLGLSLSSCKTLGRPSPTGGKMFLPPLQFSAGKSCTDQRVWGVPGFLPGLDRG